MWDSTLIWTIILSFAFVSALPVDPPVGQNSGALATQTSGIVVVDSNNGKVDSNDTTTSSSDDIVVVPSSGNNGTTPEATESSSEAPTLNSSDDSGTEHMLFDYVSEMMVAQCDGQRAPAIKFYQCLETGSSQLTQFLDNIGLNVTKLRLELLNNSINITMDSPDDDNATTGSSTLNTYATTAEDPTDTSTSNLLSSSQIQDLNTILARAYTQADRLCINVDMLLVCLDPYFDACFPDTTITKVEDNPVPIVNADQEITGAPSKKPTTPSGFDRWLTDVFDMINMFDIRQNTTNDDDQNVNATGLPPTTNEPEADTSSFPVSTSESVNDTIESDNFEAQKSITNVSEDRPRLVVVVELTMLIPDDPVVMRYPADSNQDDKTDITSEAEDVVYGFFDIPLLNQRSQISRFLSQMFRLLCESNSDNAAMNAGPASLPIKNVLANFGCINRQVSNENHDTCQTSSDRLAEVEQQIATLSMHPKETNSLIPYQDICRAVDDYSRCYIRAASECIDGQSEGETNRKDLPDILHAIVDLYLDECQSSANMYQNTAPAPLLPTDLQH